MKIEEVSFWFILRKTLLSLFFRNDKVGSLWFRARPILFFGVLFLIVLFIAWTYEDYIDFSTSYPTEDKTFITDGQISEVKINRQFFMQLENNQGRKIIFKSNWMFNANSKKGMFYDDSGNAIKRLGKVRYVMLPSGKAWIVELWIEEKIYIDENASRNDFLKHQENYTRHIIIISLFLLIIFMIVSEYRYVKKNLILGGG